MDAMGTEADRQRRAEAPRLLDGAELAGELEGSGYREPRYLVGLGDGAFVELSRLSYLLVAKIDGRRGVKELATAVSREFGRTVTAENVDYRSRRSCGRPVCWRRRAPHPPHVNVPRRRSWGSPFEPASSRRASSVALPGACGHSSDDQ
jgi:hypothetical protein